MSEEKKNIFEGIELAEGEEITAETIDELSDGKGDDD